MEKDLEFMRKVAEAVGKTANVPVPAADENEWKEFNEHFKRSIEKQEPMLDANGKKQEAVNELLTEMRDSFQGKQTPMVQHLLKRLDEPDMDHATFPEMFKTIMDEVIRLQAEKYDANQNMPPPVAPPP